MESSGSHRFGFVALIGAPNVGKSTLLNRLIGQKISITSRRPQTTRHRILGINTTPEYQAVFVDTPGLHNDHKKRINKVINRTAISSMTDVDLIVFMIDHRGWNLSLRQVFKHAESKNTPVLLVINKMDKLADKAALLPLIEQSRHIFNFTDIVPISALKFKSKDKEAFVQLIVSYLPKGGPLFPQDQITDRSSKFLAGELVREQIFLTLGQELPYAIAADATRFESNKKNILCIDVVIWVEKSSQKSIVIGKGGQQLKKIGSAARIQMEKIFEQKIFLNLWVKVKKGWADQEELLQKLGYIES